MPVQPVDASTPAVARAFDYLLGGSGHFAADRALAQRILQMYPLTAELLHESRAFLAAAVGSVAGQGVGQFIDIGAGLPTRPNTHETARGVVPGARVAYVDSDPAVIAHARGLLPAGGVRAIEGDLSEPEALLASPGLAGLIDLGQPACLVLAMVLHYLDAGTARAVAGVLTRALAPGSYVIVSGAVAGGPAGTGASGAAVPAGGAAGRRVTVAYGAADGRDHSPEEIASFFGGLDVVPPGLVDARAWPAGPPGGAPPERAGYVLCGVGFKAPGNTRRTADAGPRPA